MVQEGLVNALRHAKAATVEVSLAFHGGDLVVAIRDDGAGLPKDFHMGFGLLGMSERVRRLGGRFSVEGGADGGTLIEAAIPWPAPQDRRTETSAPQRDLPLLAAVAHA